MLTKANLLDAPEEDYMNASQLAFFEQLLIDLRQSTLEHIEEAKRRLAAPPECNDDGDLAHYEEESRVLLRVLDRERKLLPKIDAALRRIKKGDYGYCLESGEPIGIPRLLIRPTAEYSVEVKTLKENKERFYVK